MDDLDGLLAEILESANAVVSGTTTEDDGGAIAYNISWRIVELDARIRNGEMPEAWKAP